MDVGAAIFLSDEVQHAGTLAQRLEAAGYESLMLTEHTHIPVSAGMVDRTAGRSPSTTGARTTRSWRWRSRPPRPRSS